MAAHHSAQPKVIIHCSVCGKAVKSSQREFIHEPLTDSYTYNVRCHGEEKSLQLPDISLLEPGSTTILSFPEGTIKDG